MGIRVVAIILASALMGCGAADNFKDRLSDISASREQREAADSATCQRYGAKPGTDLYVACMLQLRKDRPMFTVGGNGGGLTHCDSLALGGGLTSTNCQ